MDWPSWQQQLMLIAGALLELGGLALVALENLDIRRALRRRTVRADLRVRAGVAEAGARVLEPTVTGGEPPTVEQRVAVLEREVRESRERVDRLGGDMPERLREEWHQAETQLRQEIERQANELRRLLSLGVEPSRRRWIGIGLFAAGLALQTVSNWVLAL